MKGAFARRAAGTKMPTTNTKPPRVRLREMRERVGVSGGQLAARLGYASAAGYLKYEQEKAWGDKPIPYDVIKRLIPHFRGAGNPAVTVEELLAVSDAKAIPKAVSRAFEAVVDDGQGLLTVKYRVESGVFVRIGHTRSLGASRVGTANEFPVQSQFVAVLSEEIKDIGPVGTQLHCVTPDQFPVESRRGKRCLMGVTASEDLMEITVGRIGNDDGLYGLDGLPRTGVLLGVMIGRYKRE